jgi:hypothetical protein
MDDLFPSFAFLAQKILGVGKYSAMKKNEKRGSKRKFFAF